MLLATLALLLALPAAASAVLSGANGRIAYVTGKGATDADSKVYLRIASGSFAFGANIGPVTTASGQHRHPSWSPDRTKIAYARGGQNCSFAAVAKCDIYVLDLTNPFAIPENITNTTTNEDRPAWSPDGSRIAYEAEVAGQQDIVVQNVNGGSKLNLTGASAAIEGKPGWTPDSSEIYYHTGDPTVADSLNIVKEPSGGGAVTNIATNPARQTSSRRRSHRTANRCASRGGPGSARTRPPT